MEYEPQSYLTVIRNVNRGLKTRTLIIKALKSGCTNIKEISKITGVNYQTIFKQIRNMEREGVAIKHEGKPVKWLLTDRGQKSILTYKT
ncbi:winged helix-turn-helix transcriptional regulator [Candidatus Bathyarchaeota archaeon]|nr:winged helix-turn-helix transcriptional regulator [Candidatus Bathyarchaeota archaeon]MBS7618621.1 winged helix-turn-helix transcriptional regulator [Candidatus Bathyarchaeota archaeon]